MSSENTPNKSIFEAIGGAFQNVCPRCFEGKVFRSLIKMNETCSDCKFVFEREPGYFLGATSFSYNIGFIAILPLFISLLFSDRSLVTIVAIPSIQLIIQAPFLFRFARLIWLHLDYRANPAA